jgi:phosphoribosyl-AMP cyclohydrolase
MRAVDQPIDSPFAPARNDGMWTSKTPFAPAGSKLDLEAGTSLTPRFDANGLVSAIVVDAMSGEVLMLAHMNAEALKRSIDTGDAWYFSRSRSQLWRKGESSGNVQKIVDMHIDCDQDALLIRVQQTGPACHTNAKSCFYRQVVAGPDGPVLRKR